MGKLSVRLIESNFDKKTGISTATISTKYGKFTGTAKVHPLDVKHASRFAGCEYAERRANIKYMKAHKADIQHQLKTLQDFYNHLTFMKKFNSNSWESKQLRKAIYICRKELQLWTERIHTAEQILNNRIVQRDRIIAFHNIHNYLANNEMDKSE